MPETEILSNKVVCRNIYYMLTYAIDELDKLDIEDINTENRETLDDLLSEIMIQSVKLLREKDYLSEYNKVIKTGDKPKGNILIKKSYQTGDYGKGKIVYSYNELNMNSKENKLIKSSIKLLLRFGRGISKERKFGLSLILDEMHQVDEVEDIEELLKDIDYINLPYCYRPSITASRLIIENLLGWDRHGSQRLLNTDDRHRLAIIFEKFIRNFLKIEYTNGVTTRPTYRLTGSNRINELDILVENKSIAVVIDTKWYQSKNITNNMNANIRQVTDYMLSYKENEKTGQDKDVYGLVLYAMTDANKELMRNPEPRNLPGYGVFMALEKATNLDQDFEVIKEDIVKILDEILV